MLKMGSAFAAEFDLTFNTKKTICIKFGSNVQVYDRVVLGGSLITWGDHVRHLVNIVNNKLTDEDVCKFKHSTFIGSFNKQRIGNFGGVQTDILCKLFISYCCSFYGSQLWSINSDGFTSCCVQWNNAVRKMLKLPYHIHTWLYIMSFVTTIAYYCSILYKNAAFCYPNDC